jgi:hypothetical protein
LSPVGWVILKLAGAANGRLDRQDLIDLAKERAKFDPEKSTVEIEGLRSGPASGAICQRPTSRPPAAS